MRATLRSGPNRFACIHVRSEYLSEDFGLWIECELHFVMMMDSPISSSVLSFSCYATKIFSRIRQYIEFSPVHFGGTGSVFA